MEPPWVFRSLFLGKFLSIYCAPGEGHGFLSVGGAKGYPSTVGVKWHPSICGAEARRRGPRFAQEEYQIWSFDLFSSKPPGHIDHFLHRCKIWCDMTGFPAAICIELDHLTDIRAGQPIISAPNLHRCKIRCDVTRFPATICAIPGHLTGFHPAYPVISTFNLHQCELRGDMAASNWPLPFSAAVLSETLRNAR